MALSEIPGRVWKTARKVEDLFDLQAKTTEALQEINDRLRKLEDRMTKLEAEQPHLIDAARAAAANAGTAAAGSIITDIVTRVTKAELRIDGAERRLPPPSS